MKCIDRIKRLAESVGASVDDSCLEGGTLVIDAPAGYTWDCEPGSTSIVAAVSTRGQSYAVAGTREAEQRMRHGLTKCTAEESERIEFERDEPWNAPADAPERLTIGD